jgi:hypothetical protein
MSALRVQRTRGPRNAASAKNRASTPSAATTSRRSRAPQSPPSSVGWHRQRPQPLRGQRTHDGGTSVPMRQPLHGRVDPRVKNNVGGTQRSRQAVHLKRQTALLAAHLHRKQANACGARGQCGGEGMRPRDSARGDGAVLRPLHLGVILDFNHLSLENGSVLRTWLRPLAHPAPRKVPTVTAASVLRSIAVEAPATP